LNSREIVRKTLDFGHPERVARSFDESDFVWTNHTGRTRIREWYETGGGAWELIDEWGNVWHRIDATSKGEVRRGVIGEWSDLDTYEFPNYSNPDDYRRVAETREKHPDKWLICGLGGFTFSVARKMRRMETYLMDLLLEPDRITELHDRIDAVLITEIRNYGAAGGDAIMFGEDWGTQTQLLINPERWKKEFLPRFERLCGEAHDAGLKVFMHSCGQIEQIVPWCIDAGIDLFQFDQPNLHGIDVLASHQERAKITYWCPVDIQKVLQTRDEAIIRASARELLDKLWKGRGGFVAGYYGDNPSIGLDGIEQDWASDEFLRHGVQTTYDVRRP